MPTHVHTHTHRAIFLNLKGYPEKLTKTVELKVFFRIHPKNNAVSYVLSSPARLIDGEEVTSEITLVQHLEPLMSNKDRRQRKGIFGLPWNWVTDGSPYINPAEEGVLLSSPITEQQRKEVTGKSVTWEASEETL